MSPSPKDFRILVVDDEIQVLEVMADILGATGWTVDAVRSPLEALARVPVRRYDALVLDLYMAELPGLLLHAKLKLIDRELAARTVFVSGHFLNEDLERELSAARRFVPKPFRAETLVGTVELALPEIPRSFIARPASGRPGGRSGRP